MLRNVVVIVHRAGQRPRDRWTHEAYGLGGVKHLGLLKSSVDGANIGRRSDSRFLVACGPLGCPRGARPRAAGLGGLAAAPQSRGWAAARLVVCTLSRLPPPTGTSDSLLSLQQHMRPTPHPTSPLPPKHPHTANPLARHLRLVTWSRLMIMITSTRSASGTSNRGFLPLICFGVTMHPVCRG